MHLIRGLYESTSCDLNANDGVEAALGPWVALVVGPTIQNLGDLGELILRSVSEVLL